MMAQLRTIGAYINGSGLDLSWDQADIFGECTTRQILDGGHVKRGINAHSATMQSILFLYSEAFSENSKIYKECADAADLLNIACTIQDSEQIQKAHSHVCSELERLGVFDKMHKFDVSHEETPVFKFMRNYITMVLNMRVFIKAVRTGFYTLSL